jgi:hypothetical protein
LTLASVQYILKEYQNALESAEEGLRSINNIRECDADVMKQVKNSQRDLVNLVVRSKAKVSGVSASAVREEQGFLSESLRSN